MIRIVLIRHAKAEEQSYYGDDYSRKLISKGIEKAENIANKLYKYNLPKGTFISSPAPRAYDTAKIFAKCFDYPLDKIITSDLLYQFFTPASFISNILPLCDNDFTIYVFGHNPMLYDLANYFSPYRINGFPKTAVMGYEFDCDNYNCINENTGKQFLFINPKK